MNSVTLSPVPIQYALVPLSELAESVGEPHPPPPPPPSPSPPPPPRRRSRRCRRWGGGHPARRDPEKRATTSRQEEGGVTVAADARRRVRCAEVPVGGDARSTGRRRDRFCFSRPPSRGAVRRPSHVTLRGRGTGSRRDALPPAGQADCLAQFEGARRWCGAQREGRGQRRSPAAPASPPAPRQQRQPADGADEGGVPEIAQLRLVDGSNEFEGRVEVFHNDMGDCGDDTTNTARTSSVGSSASGRRGRKGEGSS